MQRAFTRGSIRGRKLTGWLIGAAAFAITLLLRIAINHYLEFPAYVEFVPAIMLAALYGGIEIGAVVFLFSALTVWLFFVSHTVAIKPDHLSDALGFVVFFWFR